MKTNKIKSNHYHHEPRAGTCLTLHLHFLEYPPRLSPPQSRYQSINQKSISQIPKFHQLLIPIIRLLRINGHLLLQQSLRLLQGLALAVFKQPAHPKSQTICHNPSPKLVTVPMVDFSLPIRLSARISVRRAEITQQPQRVSRTMILYAASAKNGFQSDISSSTSTPYPCSARLLVARQQ